MSEMLPRDLGGAGPMAVEARSLEKRYGGTRALAGLDLSVPEGSVYVLVGPNGVGKTTTLKVLLDLVVADAGTVQVLGLDTRTRGADVRARVGYVPERPDDGYGWLRVGDALRYHAGYYPGWDDGYAGELSRLFGLRLGARLGTLSKGEQRRVQLVLALAHAPPVLLFDEPTDGLDPLMRDRTLSALAGHLARFPTTMLVSTHQVHYAERLGDHLGVMRAGRIAMQFSRDALHRHLRRYRMQLPEGWTAPVPADVVVQRNGGPPEAAWTIWGEESEVVERLKGAGATLREVEPLTLEEAVLALLSREE